MLRGQFGLREVDRKELESPVGSFGASPGHGYEGLS